LTKQKEKAFEEYLKKERSKTKIWWFDVSEMSELFRIIYPIALILFFILVFWVAFKLMGKKPQAVKKKRPKTH
jgi:hypothetical protein